MSARTVLYAASHFRLVTTKLLARNFGITAACSQTAAVDPIQKLFVDKIRDYAQKSKSSGGKLVDASPETEKSLTDELEKISRQFGAKGADFTKFPTFHFADVDLEPVGVQVEVKDVAQAADRAAEEEEDKPFFELWALRSVSRDVPRDISSSYASRARVHTLEQ